MAVNPFRINTDEPLVAVVGVRGGYLQLAPSSETTLYAALPNELFLAAKAWATVLEAQGAKRVYWITLSEVVTHLHIHLYPRWQEDEPRGLPLFEARQDPNQLPWDAALRGMLDQWAADHQVALIDNDGLNE